MIVLLDSENADRDLTTSVVVLTHTPSATEPIQCQALIYLGDGTKNLDSGTGDFEVRVEVGGQLVQPNPQIITCAGSLRVALMSAPFTVPPGEEVKIEVLSPDAADTDVDVTAHLYDVQPVDSSRVDADISSRSSHAANDVRDAILDDATRFSGGDIDEAISSRAEPGDEMDLVDAPNALALTAIAAAAWNRLTSALTTVGSIGALLVDNVNAAIDTRSSHAANDVRDAILDDATRFSGANVDEAISGRAPAGEYDTELDANISTRSSHSAGDVWSAVTRTLTDPDSYKADVSALALEVTLEAIQGAGWTTETLKAIADAVGALNDPTAQEVWEYATRALSTPADYKADVSGLAPAGEYDTKLDAAVSTRAATGEAAAAVATLNDIDVGDIMGVTVEGAFTLEEMLRISLAGLAGLVGGGGTDTITFTGIDGTTDRIIATVTTDGNRTNMVLDGS